MTEQCDKCGVEYTPMILERVLKGSKIGATVELFGYIVLGGYAFSCYYFSDSILMLFFCTVIALVLYHYTTPKYQGFCDKCIEEHKA